MTIPNVTAGTIIDAAWGNAVTNQVNDSAEKLTRAAAGARVPFSYAPGWGPNTVGQGLRAVQVGALVVLFGAVWRTGASIESVDPDSVICTLDTGWRPAAFVRAEAKRASSTSGIGGAGNGIVIKPDGTIVRETGTGPVDNGNRLWINVGYVSTTAFIP